MALIDITIENPSLISTDEDDRIDADDDGPFSDDGSQPADVDDGDLGDTMKNVSTLLTAATTVAGVVKQLRDEEGEEATSESEEAGLFDAEEEDADADTDVGEDEAESFVESVVDEEELEEEDALDEAEGTEDVEGDDSSGLGLKVALVLLVILIVLALWSRGGEEEAADDQE